MGRLDPETFEWIEDDASSPLPEPVSMPGAAPPPTFNQVAPGSPVGGGGSRDAAPADIDADGGLLPVPGAVSQQSSSTSSQRSSGSSGKAATKGLQSAYGNQSAASGLQVEAAKTQADADRKKAEADSAKADREFLENKVAGIQAEKQLQGEEALKIQVRQQTEQARARYAEEAKSGTFFENETPMRKFLWIVAAALGGYGAARTGKNQPLEMLQQTINDWDTKRTNRIKQSSMDLKNAQDWESQSIKDYNENELKQAPIKKAAAYRIFADVQRRELEANKAHLDASSMARGQKAIADAEAEASKIEVEYEKFLAPTVSGSSSSTSRSASIDQRPGGKPTEAGNLGAARAGIIVDTLTDAMNSPTISSEGLRSLNVNKGRQGLAEKAPVLDVLTGGRVSPAEGLQQGLSQPDRQAMSRQSVLNETITYLTTGAAATKEEAASKTGQLQIQPSDDKETQRTKLLNTVRYAKAAAQIGKASMTPEHLKRLNDLERALGAGGGGGGGEAKPKYTPGQVIEKGGKKWKINDDGKTATRVP